MATQATFTKQKRLLKKAVALLDRLRAMEVRTVKYSPEREKLEETRETYVDEPPEAIARQILATLSNIVAQHGQRQQANSRNTGRFEFLGLQSDLTVPQLRALQEIQGVLNELVERLPRLNPRLIPNATIDGRPAFVHREEKHFRTEAVYQPYEEDSTTRVRTYREDREVVDYVTQEIHIDHGIEIERLNRLRDLALEFQTSVQCAIDDANAKQTVRDEQLEQLVAGIFGHFLAELPNASATAESPQ